MIHSRSTIDIATRHTVDSWLLFFAKRNYFHSRDSPDIACSSLKLINGTELSARGKTFFYAVSSSQAEQLTLSSWLRTTQRLNGIVLMLVLMYCVYMTQQHQITCSLWGWEWEGGWFGRLEGVDCVSLFLFFFFGMCLSNVSGWMNFTISPHTDGEKTRKGKGKALSLLV